MSERPEAGAEPDGVLGSMLGPMARTVLRLTLLMLVGLVAMAAPAQAREPRIALVIANGAYTQFDPLGGRPGWTAIASPRRSTPPALPMPARRARFRCAEISTLSR
ncbi:hypothetical protein ACFSTD_14515 [Novosphingobium colocasiae]